MLVPIHLYVAAQQHAQPPHPHRRPPQPHVELPPVPQPRRARRLLFILAR